MSEPLPVVPAAIAPVGRRLAALVLDQLVALAAAVLLVVLWLALALPAGPAMLVGLIATVALVEAVQAVAEAVTGATVGSKVLGLRTVGAGTGLPAGLIAVLVRRLVLLAGFAVGVVGGYVVAASSAWDAGPARRGWHDKAAGTMVLLAWTVPTRAERLAAAVPVTLAAAPTPIATQVRSGVVSSGAIPTQPGPRSARARAGGSTAFVPTPVRGEPVLVGGGAPSTPRRGVQVAGAVAPARNTAAASERGPIASVSEPLLVEAADLRPSAEAVHARHEPAPHGSDEPAAPGHDVEQSADMPPRDLDPHPRTEPVEALASPPARGQASEPFDGALTDDIELTRMSEPAQVEVLRVPRIRLEFDTGERVDVVSQGAVGRDPGFTSGASAHHQVAISDPDRSVSRLHLLFGPDGDGPNLWVTDAGSTNGTVLVDPTGAAMVLEPGVRAVVEPGWSIRFGGRTAAVVLAD